MTTDNSDTSETAPTASDSPRDTTADDGHGPLLPVSRRGTLTLLGLGGLGAMASHSATAQQRQKPWQTDQNANGHTLSALGALAMTAHDEITDFEGPNLEIQNGVLGAAVPDERVEDADGRYLRWDDDQDELDFTGAAEWGTEVTTPTNAATGAGSVVAGGTDNEASDRSATVGGGDGNTASDKWSTVAGGLANDASGWRSTVGGGSGNVSSETQSTVGGGGSNTASNSFAAVGGGLRNTANGDRASVGGGEDNTASGQCGTVAGGFRNTASGERQGQFFADGEATVGGGLNNHASAPRATVAGGDSNEASDDWATVGGGQDNTASGRWATIGGGDGNAASGFDATVGGGDGNSASGLEATVGGGHGNSASGTFAATVAGGENNTANGRWATVAGGSGNTASGTWAAVAGGTGNTAGGESSFAMGRQASANHDGAFVVGDSSFSGIASQGDDEARFQMPVYAPSFNSTSARAAKTAVEAVDPQAALAGVESLQVRTWEFTATDDGRHMGPMAEDFYDAFGLGDDEGAIATVDADGVAFAAIQGLAARLDAKSERIADLEAEKAALGQRLARLEDHVGLPPVATDGGAVDPDE